MTAPEMWTRTLPHGWDSSRLRFVASTSNSNVDKKSYEGGVPVRLCNYTDVYYHEYITNSMDLMEATATPSEAAKFRLLPGDVMITKDSEAWNDIGVPACVTEPLDGVVCGYHLTLLRSLPQRLDGRYLLRSLQADGVRDQMWLAANGVTRYGIGQTGMRNVLVPVPPLRTQRAIAAYLDRKTAAIDALIEKKQTLLDLLAEKRAALINHALTAVSASMIKLSYVAEVLPGYAFSSSAFTQDEQGIPLLRGVNVGIGAVRWDDVVRWPRANADGLSRYALRAGDLVLGMDRPWIKGGLRLATIRQSDCPSLLLQRVARLRPRPGLLSEYLRLTLEWGRFKSHLEPDTTGVSVPHISGDQILAYRAPVPGLDDQSRVVEMLRSHDAQAGVTTTTLAAQLDRLREYRQALITAAVTGQLDIGEDAA